MDLLEKGDEDAGGVAIEYSSGDDGEVHHNSASREGKNGKAAIDINADDEDEDMMGDEY